MKSGVILLNFGEPSHPERAAVTAYLERIFLANARLEPDAARARARELAERRAPGLMAEYGEMGGSPLHAQTVQQATLLGAELRRRGEDAVVVVGMQFTDPDIPGAVARAVEEGARRIVGLPLYPLAGPSTTVAALDTLARSARDLDPELPVTGIGGWHTHPAYTDLRARAIRRYCQASGLWLDDPSTRLVFSAHGTPLRYLAEGSRYQAYVEDHARRLARALGVEAYDLGYQNHANRPGVEWTGPAIEDVLRSVRAERVVVVPISFMQEQSETLYELDTELREVADVEAVGFHRVPVPHADPAFATLLADLVVPLLDGGDSEDAGYGECRCAAAARAVCLAHRLASVQAG
jgi:ferrochelatase